MEGKKPARESTRFSERYVWDRRGENENEKSTTLPSRPPSSRPTTSRPATSRLQSSHRQTVQWPFLNNLVITESSDAESETSSIRPLTSSYPRRATWQPGKRNSSASLLDMVPDYIINYLRGETPETMARKREKKRNPNPEEIANQLRNQFEGFSDMGSEHDRPGSSGSEGELAQILPGNQRAKLSVRQLIRGWRGGIIINAIIAGIVVVITIVSFVIAIATERNGETRIFQGTCSASQTFNFGIHAGLSLVSMALLVAANYGFQILTSPTRVEVDMAHDAGKWLDIGVPSFRNLRSITRTRAILACVLLASAVAVQVMYNSAFFTTRIIQNASTDRSVCSLDSYDTSLGVAILLSFVCLVSLGSLLGLRGFNPLVTLGDAVASFIIRPDHPVRETCPLSKEEANNAAAPSKPKISRRQGHSWFWAPSRTRWTIWAVSWILLTGPAAFLLADALNGNVPLASPFDSFSSSSKTKVLQLGFTTNHAAPAFIAALPQLLVAFLYITTNSLLTSYSLFHELAHFGPPSPVRPLRVSAPEPQGNQTTSLFLTLPRPYSWLLLALFTPLSLFVSFSFRPVVTAPTVGAQQLGILADAPSLLAVASLLVLILGLVLLLSMRRVDPDTSTLEDGTPAFNPLVLKGRSCAAVILAQGHRLPSDRGAGLGVLTWDVTRDGDTTPGLAR